jgi:hypothetical protein
MDTTFFLDLMFRENTLMRNVEILNIVNKRSLKTEVQILELGADIMHGIYFRRR